MAALCSVRRRRISGGRSSTRGSCPTTSSRHALTKSPHHFVFQSPRGAVLRVDNFRRNCFDAACVAVGLGERVPVAPGSKKTRYEGFTPHELRHTAASLAIAAGASVKAIQSMLGHASAAMTLDRYGHLFGDELDAVAERLDEAAEISRTNRGLAAVRRQPAQKADTA